MAANRKRARTHQRRANAYDWQVVERLAALRKVRGLSQRDSGQKLGITFQQVQNYDRCTNRISAGRLYEIARLLDVRIEYFFDDVNPARERSRDQAVEFAAQFAAVKNDKVRHRVLQLIAASASRRDQR